MLDPFPSIADAVRRIKAGALSPEDLVEHCLARIEQFDQRIKAWVLVDAEGARKRAEELMSAARRGESHLLPLLGVPVAIKDIIDVAGMPTRAGSPLRENYVAQRDAPLVARLRRAGAIILGKTVTTEFACFDPSPTRNPWNPEHTPGGSSSGSAAAVPLEMCLGAIGSQTGGSITRPAAYCGAAGLKPTRGAIPLEGVVPVSFTLDHPGPIARCVDDLQILFMALSDTVQPGMEPLPTAPQMVRLGGYFDGQCDDSVRRVIDDVARQLVRGSIPRGLGPVGAEMERIEPPPTFPQVHVMHRRIMAAEAAAYHRTMFTQHRDQFGPHVSSLIEEGLSVSAADYLEALEHRRRFRAELTRLLAGRVALLPAATCTAPASLETTGDPAFNSPFSFAGVPALNFPCGLAENGMPCGLQLVAPPNCENQLLVAGTWCERVLDINLQPPLLREG
jgi:Asp-tRNA(Asn)/Glu-tRNA(Gln) amidotransferase A subunit family amidase